MLYAVPRKWTLEQLADLGTRVRQTRQRAGISADDAAASVGMSPVTWLRVEAGRPVRGLTYAGIERALQWAAGSIETFLNTGTEPESPARAAPENADGVIRDIKEILDDPDLSEDDKIELTRILMDAWERDEEAARRARLERARNTVETWKRARSA